MTGMMDIIKFFDNSRMINKNDKDIILDVNNISIYTQYIPVLKKMKKYGYNIIITNVRSICTPVQNYCINNNIMINHNRT
jgi:histidinol phosphatase-like enzyme